MVSEQIIPSPDDDDGFGHRYIQQVILSPRARSQSYPLGISGSNDSIIEEATSENAVPTEKTAQRDQELLSHRPNTPDKAIGSDGERGGNTMAQSSETSRKPSSKKTPSSLTKSWSMLEMQEMQIIHNLQDDMENMLSNVDEEVHPRAIEGLRHQKEEMGFLSQGIVDNTDDDDDDGFMFYEDEEQYDQPKTTEVEIQEDLDRLSAIDEEQEERGGKTVQKLTKRNILQRLGMPRSMSLANFRSDSDMNSTKGNGCSSTNFQDLDSTSHRRQIDHQLDDNVGNDGCLLDVKKQHLGDLDVTLRRVNKSVIESGGDSYNDSAQRIGNQSISPHSILDHPDQVSSQERKEPPRTTNESLISNLPVLLPPMKPSVIKQRPISLNSEVSNSSTGMYQHDRTKKPVKSILRRSSLGSFSEACSITTTEDESCYSETSSNKKENMKRTTSFSTLEIREYNVTIGDNPGGSHGPPISLDWDYCPDRTINMCIDKYEKIRPPRRKRCEFYMNGSIRMWTLMKEQGYSLREIRDAAKAADQIRKKRQRSLSKNPIHKLGYKVGKIFGR